jgi:uncharacterized membrane protein
MQSSRNRIPKKLLQVVLQLNIQYNILQAAIVQACHPHCHFALMLTYFSYQSVINAVQVRITFFWQLVGISKVTLSGILINHYPDKSSILFFVTLLCDSEEQTPILKYKFGM